MFKTRLISGIILVLIAIIAIVSGGYVLWGLMAAISAIGLYEFYRATRVARIVPVIGGYLGLVMLYLLILFKFDGHISITASGCVVLIILAAMMVFGYPKYQLTQIAVILFGFYYVPVMLLFIYLTRMLPHGRVLVWLIILSAWGCDTLAYCTGMLIGKHPMTPKLSPKKTIEGGIGGIAGAALLGCLYGLIMHFAAPASEAHAGWYALICAAGAVISQIGDLAASAIKRHFDIKDYGKLIPGHGGIMDRFDSVIITAPVIYFLSLILFR